MALHISVKGRVQPNLPLIKISRRVYEAFLGAEKLPPKWGVSLLFCDNRLSRYLNNKYRKKDYPTDVLSFPQYENREEADREKGETLMLGDVVISLEKAGEQAEELGHSLHREAAFLLMHGLLHLVGYDHDTPEREIVMRVQAENVLEAFGYGRKQG